MSAAALRSEIGGRWDGGDRELHGLVDQRGDTMKVELLRRKDGWHGTAFVAGAAVASGTHADPVALVKSMLRELER